jgi:hypothetical protein
MVQNRETGKGIEGKPLLFYRCYGSAHSSIISASIHVGIMPSHKVPDKEKILDLPFFDKTPNELIGTPLYFGEDENGYNVYAIGMASDKGHVEKSIQKILGLYNIPHKNLIFIDTLHRVGVSTRLGGFLSRRLEWVSIGRPLVIWSLQQNYKNFVELVKKVKNHYI